MSAAFDDLAEQFLHLVGRLDFEMTEVLVTDLGQSLDGLFKGACGVCGQRR